MAGETVRSVAVRFGMSVPRRLFDLARRLALVKICRPRPRGAPPEMIIRGEVADWVRSRLAEKPDLTVRTLAAELCERGTSVTHDTVWRSCAAKASPSKKTLVASEQDRPKVARFRDRWKAHQHRISADRLVFLDETWIKTNMTPPSWLVQVRNGPCRQGSAWTLEDVDVHRRAASGQDRGALRVRRSD